MAPPAHGMLSMAKSVPPAPPGRHPLRPTHRVSDFLRKFMRRTNYHGAVHISIDHSKLG